ncbi:MAG: hypothetical protein ACMVO3_22835 [Thalassobaculum sp.]
MAACSAAAHQAPIDAAFVTMTPDGKFHACVVTDEYGTGESAFVRCLYVPLPGV